MGNELKTILKIISTNVKGVMFGGGNHEEGEEERRG
jgi:hypothetical protein